jgi:uncharacterized protein YyaL (SSP411 family)
VKRLLALSLALALLSGCAAPAIVWQPWSDGQFDQAKREHRLVLMHLGAVWCHWCHVMESTTYEDPAVVGLVCESYLPVKVDQDARPDLSNRYEDYGWPATIIFDSSGRELAKLRGYIEPARMAELLRAFVADPTPGPSALGGPSPGPRPSEATTLTKELRDDLLERYRAGWDDEHGGWGRSHKYLDPETVELALRRAFDGDAESERRARTTLDLTRSLIDPAWGGVYQYSDGGVWGNPHFEKIMSYQAGDLRTFALAHAQLGDPASLGAARDILRFLETFLSREDGAFYVSQDADVERGKHSAEYFALGDRERRARGIPAVDRHVYARENGWAIEALTSLYEVTGEPRLLERARAAAELMVAERAVAGGGFRHDAKDEAGPYLGDTLAMGRAFLALHEATGEPRWLDLSRQAARFALTFKGEAGFLTAKSRGPLPSLPQVDENVALARWANRLHHLTGDASFRALAEHAMRFLASPEVARSRGWATAGILLADQELASEPVHISISGKRDDRAARALFAAALRIPTSYKIVDWKDEAETPVATVCGQGTCSPPVTAPEGIIEAVRRASR